MNIVILLGIVITVATGVPVMRQLLKTHPRGLFVLFFAEMWERFSYYGMRGLLIFYLTQHLLFSDERANRQYGSYTSLVYLLPLIGGVVADRWLGTRKAVLFGAILLTLGHFTMAIEPRPSTQTLVYQHHQYEVRMQGRGDARRTALMVDGKPYSYGASADGGLAIHGVPPGASLPPVLPKGSFQTIERRDAKGVSIFYLALSLIIMGVGFLKPNISTIVGQLYGEGDPRRDSGFTLYYYGINLGAFWAAILCGLIGQNIGWWAGFGLAGVGMAAGWVGFTLGKPLLQGRGEPPDPQRLKAKLGGVISREWLIYLLGIAGVAVIFPLVQRNELVGAALTAGTVLALVAIAVIIVFVCKTRFERERMGLATVLIFGAVVFWTLFEQAGSSLNLFADRNVNLNLISAPVSWRVAGLDLLFASQSQVDALFRTGADLSRTLWIDVGLSAAQTQSFNSGYILLFAPLFAAMWTWLGQRRRDPNPMLKFGLGLVQVGLGFMVVVWGAGFADASARMPLVLLGLLYLLHTTGELFLSPVGLSEITKLSLASVVSFMMAVWFLASSIAQFVGGKIAALAGAETVGGQVLDPKAALQGSLHVFQMIGLWGIGFGVAFILLSPILKRWAHEVAAPPDGAVS